MESRNIQLIYDAMQNDLKHYQPALEAIASKKKITEKPIKEGKWSVTQICDHLYQEEKELALQLKTNITRNPEELEDYRFKDLVWVKMMGLALNTPFAFSAPAHHKEIYRQTGLEEVLKDWLAIRQELSEIVHYLPSDIYQKRVFHLPVAGWFNPEGAIYFVYEHFKRHMRQVKHYLIRNAAYPTIS